MDVVRLVGHVGTYITVKDPNDGEFYAVDMHTAEREPITEELIFRKCFELTEDKFDDLLPSVVQRELDLMSELGVSCDAKTHSGSWTRAPEYCDLDRVPGSRFCSLHPEEG